MNDDLMWELDAAAIEWLIVLAMLIIPAVVGAVVTRQSLSAFIEQGDLSDNRSQVPGTWHSESTERVLESLKAGGERAIC